LLDVNILEHMHYMIGCTIACERGYNCIDAKTGLSRTESEQGQSRSQKTEAQTITLRLLRKP
jgi:hypothetical protein